MKKTGRIARLSQRFGRWDDAHADNPDPDQPSDWRNVGKMWIATKVASMRFQPQSAQSRVHQ
jgi:hypothetical protein